MLLPLAWANKSESGAFFILAKNRKKGGDKVTKKKVIYIEVSEDDYRALKLVRDIANASWKTLLIMGAMYVVDRCGGEEKFLEIVKEATDLAKKIEKIK